MATKENDRVKFDKFIISMFGKRGNISLSVK